MKMHAILRLLLAGLLLLVSGLSYAACSASSSTSTFGGISAFTFASSAQTITTGSGTSQTINYTATINPTQASPPAGTYSDVVTVTVTY